MLFVIADNVLLTKLAFLAIVDTTLSVVATEDVDCVAFIGINLISTFPFLLGISFRTLFLSPFSVTCACLLSAFPFIVWLAIDLFDFCAVTSSVHVDTDVLLNGEPGSDESLVAVESALMVTTPLLMRRRERKKYMKHHLIQISFFLFIF